ncbi:NUDIX hydrolase [Nocardia sp. NPDC050435]|uniref:NUDIX hydrolase n=1 Tax=Nocardia sp. NPDC050435 TaxID=3155040 RepID=UPI0033E93CEF
MSADNPWQTLSSREVYKNKWLSVREDQVIRPDGQEGIYGVVELPYSVGIVALDAEGRIALVEQWRYTQSRVSVEIPVGSSQAGDADPLDAARRELLEETGFVAADWLALGSIDNGIGATTDVAHQFLARNLSYQGAVNDPEESIAVRWAPVEEAADAVRTGKITESSSVVAILKTTEYLAGNDRWVPK